MPHTPIRLLLVDDDVEFANFIETLLVGTTNQSIKVDHVADYEHACKLLAADKHDVYLVDHELGLTHKTGLDLISYGSEITGKPMIMLTSNTAEDAPSRAIALGASDFLQKQHATIPVIENVVRNSISRSALLNSDASANKMPMPLHRDQLTGVRTRIAIERFVDQCLQACEYGQTGALFYLDVKDFKPVNEYYGHVAGDQVLKIFARRIQESAPPDFVLGRLGGDEFLLTGPAADHDIFADGTVERWSRAMQNAIARPMKIFDVAGEAATVRVSTGIGAVRFTANSGHRDYLVALANRAMRANAPCRSEPRSD
ncbi:MAG: diguanylate cyclase [Gammaproteobacteria bacterium]|nr:diguanylate cyclase [Gammaproteobacteria bacterium]